MVQLDRPTPSPSAPTHQQHASCEPPRPAPVAVQVQPSRLLRYGVALGSAAVAVLLRDALNPLWGDRLPFLTLYPAVLISAWYGGMGPGLLATALGACAASYLWLAPFHLFTPRAVADHVGLALAVLVMLFITWLTAALRRAHETLERRVQARTAELDTERTRLRTILEQLPVGVIIVDAASRETLLANAQAKQIWRYETLPQPSPAEMRRYQGFFADGRPYHDDEWPLIRALTTGETITEEEIAFIRGDGSRGVMCVNAAPIRAADGHITAGVVTILDVTTRKHIEEELRALNAELDQRVQERTAALQESEARFRLLADSAPVLIWVNNLDGCEFVNHEYLRFLGVVETDVRGYDWSPFLHPEDRDAYLSAFLDAMAERRRFTAQFRFRRYDGVYRWMQSVALPRFDARGQCLGYVGSSADITDLKDAENALAQHARELARAHADLRQVAYVSAHDLQEPVRQISVFTQRIAHHYHDAPDAAVQEALAFIGEGTKRMQAQFTDLLHYLEIDEPHEGMTATDGEQLLQHVLDGMCEAIVASNATVTHDPLPTLTANATQLRLVFQELLDNAVKFRNSVPPRVHVWAERDAQAWRFAVRDNGIGIAQPGMGQLFGFFRKLHRRHDYPGTGMGLAICKKIVDRHNGRMWIESRPGEGTTVFFTVSDGIHPPLLTPQ